MIINIQNLYLLVIFVCSIFLRHVLGVYFFTIIACVLFVFAIVFSLYAHYLHELEINEHI